MNKELKERTISMLEVGCDNTRILLENVLSNESSLLCKMLQADIETAKDLIKELKNDRTS